MNIFKKFVNFFELQELPQSASLEEQRKMWFRGFLKTYAVVSIVYAVVYFLRYNFKAAQPLLKSQVGMTTTDLAWIGVAFSITYGVGRVILGYIIDGRNAKKAISFLLIISAFASLLIGISLFSSGNHFGLLLVLWAINGLVQGPPGL